MLMWVLSYKARKRFQLKLEIQKQPVKPTRPCRAGVRGDSFPLGVVMLDPLSSL